MKVWRYFQRPVVAITVGSTALFAIIVLVTSKAHFISHWNSAAARYHSLTYSQLPTAVAHASGVVAMPHTWSWADTFGSISAVYMFVIYGYAMAYVSGEVKRPDTTMLKANAIAVLVPAVIGVAAFLGLSHMLDFNFLSATAYNNLNGGVKGYNLPFSTSFMDLTFIASGFNRVIGVLLSLTWILVTISMLSVITIMLQRVIFAWGMDRMGPRFFTDINARWASPIKGYALIAGGSAVLEIAYVLWLQNALVGLVAGGMMVVSVFAVTGISAIVFPYRKRAKGIWDSSPYKKWQIAGVPVITIAGVVYFAVVCLVIYFGFLDHKTRDATGKNLIEFAVVWALGIAWYFVWRWHGHRKVGDAMSLVYQELPPE
jgi:amino acid transporter